MRSDMAKVIVERPRVRGGWGPQGGRDRMRVRGAIEDAPLREKMRPSRGRKSFNENLAPLRRFLGAQVGRPWAAVYAEICAHIKLSSTIQRHVLQHLAEMVVREVEMVGKQPTERSTGRPIHASPWRACMYVCPVTGLLRRTPVRPRAVAVPTSDRLELRDGSQLQRIRGVWYHVGLSPVPGFPDERRRAFDVVVGKILGDMWIVRPQLLARHGRDDVYAVSKRPIGKRELARLLPEDLR